MNEDTFRMMYTFSCTATEHPMPADYPDETITMTFDGTDARIGTIVSQFEKFLRASGYVFDRLEVVTGA